MQSKVSKTRMHEITINKTDGYPAERTGDTRSILVTDGIFLLIPSVEPTKVILQAVSKELNRAIGNFFFNPIIISETEQIEVGDPWININDQTLGIHYSATEHDVQMIKQKNATNCKKILALPENFTSKQIQAINDKRLRDGDKLLVECTHVQWATVKPETKWIYAGHRLKVESVNVESNRFRVEDGRELRLSLVGTKFEKEHNYTYTLIYERDLILETECTVVKLNTQKHITLHKEKEPTFTREEVRQEIKEALIAFNKQLSINWREAYVIDWFEKNIK
jgi:hypothetical protein